MTSSHRAPTAERASKLPISGLLAISAAGFLTAMLETMPAGILPAVSASLGVSESVAGQMVSVYALGSIAGAIPIISATLGWPRRRLLVIALVGYVVTSVVVALSPWVALTLVSRFIAGIFAGVTWGISAGYASRITPPAVRGRGMTIALSGGPLALAIGTPIGALIAEAVGWRAAFLVMAALTAVVLVWVLSALPNVPGQAKAARTSVIVAVRRPGVLAVVVSSVLLVMGHNALYTYSSSFVAPLGDAVSVSAVLMVFGTAALVALWIVGTLIDRHLRRIMLVSVVLFAAAMLAFALLSSSVAAVYASAAAWGLAFGGAGSTVPQKALTDAAGDAVDAAQSVLVTGWNIGIALGGVIGGAVLSGLGAQALPWTTLLFLVPVFVIAFLAKRHGYPAVRAATADPVDRAERLLAAEDR